MFLHIFTFTDVHDDLQVERGFTLWADGNLTIDVVESTQRSGTRFKFIGQQKDWSFSFDKWGRGVNEYVISVLKMEPASRLALCDEVNEMAKNIAKKAVKRVLTSVLENQPTKALGRHALVKEGCPPPT